MAGASQFFAGHPTIQIGAGTGDGSSAVNAGSSALAIKQRTGTTTDGLYWIKPLSGAAIQVWCDMNTSGGGWMLVARTHPTGAAAAGTWGWRGPGIGAPTTYTSNYQLNLLSLYNNGFRFGEYIFGNQLTNDSNNWGPFIYSVGGVTTIDLMTSDTPQYPTYYNTLKSDTNVYGSNNSPSMQYTYGFAVSATAMNVYHMRDCCGAAGYGVTPTGMATTYVNAASPQFYSGPWVNNTLSGNTYVQGGSSAFNNMGGTIQCMIMVR